MAFIFKKPRKAPVRKKQGKEGQEILARLNRYLAENGGEPVRFLAQHWKDEAAVFSYQEIRQAVESGHIQEETMRLWRQDYSKLVSEKMYPVWKGAIDAGMRGQPVMDRHASEMAFNMNEPSVLSWLETRGAEFVTRCTDEQKKAIQALLVKKIADRHTVDELAELIRPCIGLTEAQAKANVRYYDHIVATLREDHPRMSEETIEKKARDAQLKYAEKQHRYRAHTIAQTEMAIAYNKGADEAIRQAQAAGLMGEVEKKWITSGDENVCDICHALEGIQIGMDEEFNFKGRPLYPGSKRLPPAHPRCACGVQYIEVGPPQWKPVDGGAMPGDLPNPSHETTEEENISHDPPKYLGSLDNMSEDVVISTLEEYEKEIVGYEEESAVVITETGLVFQCFGDKNAVYPNIDLERELYGAHVTHNHPISETHFSFSYDDIFLFMFYELSQLRGVDLEYIYTIKRTSKTDYAEMADLEHAYKGENYIAFLEEVLYGHADAELDEYDFYVRRLAKKYGFQYERKKK